LARTPINTPGEIRKRIHKCNYTVAQLMREMAESTGTPAFIDWTDLIERVKYYRSELETELAASGATTEPEVSAEPDTTEYDSDFDDEVSY
jgi:hypothetical protein